jgi:hypothetical protein
MKFRLTFLVALFFFSVLAYWSRDLPDQKSFAEAPSKIEPASTTELPLSKVRHPSNTPKTGVSQQIIALATSLANRSRYTDAIALLKTIPAEDQNFAPANRLQNQWGEAILARGKAKLKQGKVSEGKAILKAIPKTVQAHAEAARLIAQQSL